jgi:hypothetical protein
MRRPEIIFIRDRSFDQAASLREFHTRRVITHVTHGDLPEVSTRTILDPQTTQILVCGSSTPNLEVNLQMFSVFPVFRAHRAL